MKPDRNCNTSGFYGPSKQMSDTKPPTLTFANWLKALLLSPGTMFSAGYLVLFLLTNSYLDNTIKKCIGNLQQVYRPYMAAIGCIDQERLYAELHYPEAAQLHSLKTAIPSFCSAGTDPDQRTSGSLHSSLYAVLQQETGSTVNQGYFCTSAQAQPATDASQFWRRPASVNHQGHPVPADRADLFNRAQQRNMRIP